MPTRREVITAVTLGTPALLAAVSGGTAIAEPKGKTAPTSAPPAFAGKHAIVPLPFDPKKLTGISERMITSHHENNYGGALKNLNKTEEQLASLPKDAPGFLVGALKERELTFANSMVLHEAYFGNLGGNGKASGAIEKRLAAAYGSLARWEDHFRATGQALGGGSGWVILEYDFHAGDVRTRWSGNHTQSAAFGASLLVMDMYEHAYAIDYGAAAAKYIDAFFQNVNWEEVNRRLERAEKAATALRT